MNALKLAFVASVLFLACVEIHPTSAMHAILSTEMVNLVVTAIPEPHTYAMMLAGILLMSALVAGRRELDA